MNQAKNILFRRTLAVLLSALLLALTPLHALADTPDYVSEIKIGMGKTAEEAYNALAKDGYTVLTYGDGYENSTGGDNYKKYADLNEKAGSDAPLVSKGDKVVLLGYKTTKDKNDAITDLALMNMRGGYSVNDYDALMEYQINNQIQPLVNKLLAAIQEYRANYVSANQDSKARADFAYDMLNRMVDDDTGMKMGDLFLNESKEELGDAYDKLSDTEKKRHGDLTTIFMQSNGKLLYTMESMLARAADTNEESWVTRFTAATEESLLAQFGNMLPADAEKQLDRRYNDLANQLLSGWEAMREQLLLADKVQEKADEILDVNLMETYSDVTDDIEEGMNVFSDVLDRFADEEGDAAVLDEELDQIADAAIKKDILTEAAQSEFEMIMFARAAEVMKQTAYQGGTLYDFFTQPASDLSDDESIRALYPICAALSEGQKAALDFLPLYELVLIGSISGREYAELMAQEDEKEDELTDVSIYDGVNRELYREQTVALTSENLREKAVRAFRNTGEVNESISLAREIFMYASAVSIAGTLGVAAARFIHSKMHPYFDAVRKILNLNKKCNAIDAYYKPLENAGKIDDTVRFAKMKSYLDTMDDLQRKVITERIPEIENQSPKAIVDDLMEYTEETKAYMKVHNVTRNRLSYVMYGLEVAAIVMTAATVALTWIELQQYYNVTFTKLPKYMVDEADITAYDENGNKIVLQNQAAYYTAAETNRGADAEYYDMLNVYADLNGDVGREWLALYWAKDLNTGKPIIASSLFVQVGKSGLPEGYTKGIHMFGSGGAANLVNDFYCWNDDVNGIYVFYKTDDTVKPDANTAPGAAGSAFTGGNMILAGGAGLAVGALISGFATAAAKKKKYAKDY